MQLTGRGLLFLLLSAPIMAASVWLSLFEWVGWGWLLFAVALLYFDWRQAGPISRFEIQRHHDSRLSLGGRNEIRVEAVPKAKSGRTVPVQIRDEPPPDFLVEENFAMGEMGPDRPFALSYVVIPRRRGNFGFGKSHLRWEGPLGLVRRQGSVNNEISVKVYPNLLEVRKYDLLLKQNRLRELGLRHTRITGDGTEFEGLREYRQGDSFRRINWKSTARRNRPITVEYQTERSQNIITMIDVGRMMQSTVSGLSKLDHVLNTVLLLGYVASGMGDRIGLLTFADQVQTFVRPRQGREQFYRMLELLYQVEPEPVEPAYSYAINHLMHKQRRRSLAILFTDLSSGYGLDSLIKSSVQLSKRHLTLVVTIKDPDVVGRAESAATSTDLLYQRMVAQKMLDERTIGLDRLKQHGVLTLDLPANGLSIGVIDRYLDLKSRLKI